MIDDFSIQINEVFVWMLKNRNMLLLFVEMKWITKTRTRKSHFLLFGVMISKLIKGEKCGNCKLYADQNIQQQLGDFLSSYFVFHVMRNNNPSKFFTVCWFTSNDKNPILETIALLSKNFLDLKGQTCTNQIHGKNNFWSNPYSLRVRW